jgi:DivIVA domain-containing protein
MKFKRVRSVGYDISQVDGFFDDIRARWSSGVSERELRFVKFRKVRYGYSRVQVDAGLRELELAVSKQTALLQPSISSIRYSEVVANQIDSLLQVIQRQKRNYFSRGGAIKPQMSMNDATELSYHIKSVDKAVRHVSRALYKRTKLDTELVKNLKFPVVPHQKGYSTQEVDIFFDDVVTVLNAQAV